MQLISYEASIALAHIVTHTWFIEQTSNAFHGKKGGIRDQYLYRTLRPSHTNKTHLRTRSYK